MLFDEQVSHTAGHRPEQNPAGLVSAQTGTDDGNTFALQETFCKQSILTPDIRQPRDHPGAAKDLSLESLASRATRQKSIDQKLHGVNARAHLLGSTILSWQQEVIHSPDAGHGISHAGCDAAAQQGLQHSRWIVRHKELTLDDQDPVFLAGCRG